MTKIPPALAFYFRHAKDIDALVALEEHPPEVVNEDWDKFQKVYARARDQAENWLNEARRQARNAISSRAETTPGNKNLKGDWYAFAKIRMKNEGPRAFRPEVYLGIELGVDRGGAPYLAPYLATDGAAKLENAKELVKRLKKADFSLPPADDESLAGEVITLRSIAIGEDSTVEDITENSTSAFRDLAARWDVVFG